MSAASNPFVHQSYRNSTEARTNRFGPSAAHWSESMTHCPHCRSTDLRSNKFDNMPFDTVARGVLDAYKAGKTAHAFSAAAVWTLVAITNQARSAWSCNGCGGVF